MSRSAARFRAGATSLRRLAFSSFCLGALACNERPSDLREWRVSDHDHTDSPGSGQVQVDPNAASAAPAGLDDVTIVAWSQNCTQCHGQLGRGDGPRGPMLKATNLSDPQWQSAVTDEHIAKIIKEGKGAMPASNLPDGTITNLVKLVRLMNAARMPAAHGGSGAAAEGSGGAAAGPSAAGGAPPVTSGAGGAAPRPATVTPKPSAP